MIRNICQWCLVVTLFAFSTLGAIASSHREAPLIAKNPAADNTDVYFFRSPENPNRVILIACFNPLELPYGGPNFHSFDPDVDYIFHIDNNADAKADFNIAFKFQSFRRNNDTFLYNTGAVSTLDDPDLNFYQTYSIIVDGSTVAAGLPVAPANVGSASMPDYSSLANQAIVDLGVARVFAGPRDDGFFVNLAQIFDLIAIDGNAFDGVAGTNVHTIALEVLTDLLTAGSDGSGILGMWSSTWIGGKQVSRLSAPLVNEVVIPLGSKDSFNSSHPRDDSQFLSFVTEPELAGLFGALFGCPVPDSPRNDLVSVFLTGVAGLNQPPNVTASEMMRLNTGVEPLSPGDPGYSPLGVIGGDLSGYPNGRRVHDDVTDVSLRAIAGILINGFADDCLSLSDGVQQNDRAYLNVFPFLADPHSGN